MTPPPNPVRNLHDPPPPYKIKTHYLRSEFIEHLYHISHNAMTSVMYFKQFGRTTHFYSRQIKTIHPQQHQASEHPFQVCPIS